MKFATPRCPTCGKIAKGTIESIPGVALLNFDEDGVAEYAGETDVCWDGQEARITDDSFHLICAEGHEWRSPFANPEKDADEAKNQADKAWRPDAEVRPPAADVKRSFWFHTEGEANAFIEGVNYVNDSAIELSDMVQEREEGEEAAWRVDMKDEDAQEPLTEANFHTLINPKGTTP